MKTTYPNFSNNLQRMVSAAVYAALTYVATLVIHIPVPGTASGYINTGDAFVILSGSIIGGIYGALAAAIGSALADLTLGYAVYIPATFLIKGLMAFSVSLIIRNIRTSAKLIFTVFLIASFIAEIIMIGGYFIFSVFLYGLPAALVSVPLNCVQGIAGILIAAVLRMPLLKILKVSNKK